MLVSYIGVGFAAFIIWGIFFLAYLMRKSSKKRDKTIEAFLEEEREANATRKKEIDAELFYTPDLSDIPLLHDESKQEKNVIKISKRTMIRFKEGEFISNTELKKTYGASQLDKIIQYEENFNEYLASLIVLAELRIENGLANEAIRVLEHTLELGSEFRKSYSLAAELYLAGGKTEKLTELLATAENHKFKDLGIKSWVIKTIGEKISNS